MLTRSNMVPAISLALTAMLYACCVRGEPLWPLEQTFQISAGAFLFDTDTTVRVDGTRGRLGTQIDMEDQFGFENQTRLRLDGYWRFADRHKVRFMYFASRAESERQIMEAIDFRDVTFPVHAFVRAEFDADVIELAYEYSFMRRDEFELAGTLGLHNLSVSANLSAGVSSALGAGGVDLHANAKGDGPLPVFGVRALWAFSDRLYLDAQAQFFVVEIDNYDGSLHDYKVALVWQPIRNLGLGIGYNDFVTRLDVEEERFTGRLRFEYGGALAFLTLAF